MAASNQQSRKYSTHFFPTIGEALYLSEDYADFHFVFNSGERIPTHKNILGTASDIFRAMFSGSYIEKTEAEIVDASADAFKEFLQFIYLPKATVTLANAAEVMYLGKKYDITECFNICALFMRGYISNDDALWIYEAAKHLGHERLKETCSRYVELNTKAIFESDEFLTCDQKIVKWILQMDTLSCPEVDVFEALIKWMKAESGPADLTPDIVQNQFSDLVHEIRFGSMSKDMFSSLDPTYGALLTPDEHNEIVQMINSDHFQPTIFKKNRRHTFEVIEWNEDAIIECFRYSGESVPYYIKNVETTTFTVNKRVLLGGFICSEINYRSDGSVRNLREYSHDAASNSLQCQLTIIQSFGLANPNGKVVLFEETADLLNSEGHQMEIVLPTPILIQPGLVYRIQVKTFDMDGYWLTATLEKRLEIASGIIVQFHNDTIVENAARGLLEELFFNEIE